MAAAVPSRHAATRSSMAFALSGMCSSSSTSSCASCAPRRRCTELAPSMRAAPLVLLASFMNIVLASGLGHLRAAARGRRLRVVVALWRRCTVPAMWPLPGAAVVGIGTGWLWLFPLSRWPVPWVRGGRLLLLALRAMDACRCYFGWIVHRGIGASRVLRPAAMFLASSEVALKAVPVVILSCSQRSV